MRHFVPIAAKMHPTSPYKQWRDQNRVRLQKEDKFDVRQITELHWQAARTISGTYDKVQA